MRGEPERTIGDGGDEHRHATYVVRIWRDASDEIRGVVVRVATGERFAFAGLDRMGPLLRERVTMDIGRAT